VHFVVSCRRHARRADTGNHRLPKSKHDVAVSCVKQCYTTGVGVLASETEIMTAGNVLFVGVIGLGIDAASGAMNKYQPGVEIAMSPIPNCGAEKGAGRAYGKHASASTRTTQLSPHIELPIPRLLG